MKKCVKTLQKQTMGVIFSTQNSQLVTRSYRQIATEEIFQVHGYNRPVANLPVVDFRSQPILSNTNNQTVFILPV